VLNESTLDRLPFPSDAFLSASHVALLLAKGADFLDQVNCYVSTVVVLSLAHSPSSVLPTMKTLTFLCPT